MVMIWDSASISLKFEYMDEETQKSKTKVKTFGNLVELKTEEECKKAYDVANVLAGLCDLSLLGVFKTDKVTLSA